MPNVDPALRERVLAFLRKITRNGSGSGWSLTPGMFDPVGAEWPAVRSVLDALADEPDPVVARTYSVESPDGDMERVDDAEVREAKARGEDYVYHPGTGLKVRLADVFLSYTTTDALRRTAPPPDLAAIEWVDRLDDVSALARFAGKSANAGAVAMDDVGAVMRHGTDNEKWRKARLPVKVGWNLDDMPKRHVLWLLREARGELAEVEAVLKPYMHPEADTLASRARRIVEKWKESEEALLAAASDAARLEAALKGVVRAVDEEPELPGDPPAEMVAALRDPDAAAEALRLTVRHTKAGIRERVVALLPKGPRG